MAITIDFIVGDLEQGCNMEKPFQHISFINDLFGKEFTAKTILDQDEPDTWVNIYFYNPTLSMDDVSCWQELEEYANENEVYIIVYDHESKERKGYWYDEDEVWINMETEIVEEYEANVPE